MKRIMLITGWCLSIILLFLIVISTLDHLDVFSKNDAFYGSDYLPPLWVGVLVVLPVLLFLLSRKRKLALILTILTCLYLFAFGDFSLSFLLPQNRPQSNTATKITVAALNVQYYSQGVDEVMNGIRSLGADVALLSENDLTESAYALVKKKIMPMELRMGHKNSTAILSRFPIVEFNEIELPSYEASLSGSNDINQLSRQPHRSFVHAVLQVNGTKIHVVSIRLIAGRPKNNSLEENMRWGKYLLATQMQEADAFTAYLRGLHGPIIFGGDLNAPPFSKPMRKIQCIANDAYMANHLWGDFTFRTDFPRMRLDYLFCMNNVVPEHACRPQLLVSDHFPVVADFWVPTDHNASTKKPGIAALQ